MSQFTNENQITGSVDVNNFPAVQPVSGTVTANAGTGPFPVSDNGGSLTVDGSVSVNNFPGAGTDTATVSNISVDTNSTTLSNSNPAKTKVIIFNETGTLYLKYGSGASATSYTSRLTANTIHIIDGYTGIVTARKASGTTPVLVTELGI